MLLGSNLQQTISSKFISILALKAQPTQFKITDFWVSRIIYELGIQPIEAYLWDCFSMMSSRLAEIPLPFFMTGCNHIIKKGVNYLSSIEGLRFDRHSLYCTKCRAICFSIIKSRFSQLGLTCKADFSLYYNHSSIYLLPLLNKLCICRINNLTADGEDGGQKRKPRTFSQTLNSLDKDILAELDL